MSKDKAASTTAMVGNDDGLTWFDSQESEAFKHVKVKFALPQKPTIRQQLAFKTGQFNELSGGGYMQNWSGALSVLSFWECDKLPQPEALDVDNETDPAYTDIVTFVAVRTHSHFSALDDVPKNS